MKKYVLILSLLFFFHSINSYGDNHYYKEMFNGKYSRLELALEKYSKWINSWTFREYFDDEKTKRLKTLDIRKHYQVWCDLNYNPLILECNVYQKRIQLNKDLDLGMRRISQFVAKEMLKTLTSAYNGKVDKDRILHLFLYQPSTYSKSTKKVKNKIKKKTKDYSNFINKNLKVFVTVSNLNGFAASTDYLFKGTKKTGYECITEYLIFPVKEEKEYWKSNYPYFSKSQIKERCDFD